MKAENIKITDLKTVHNCMEAIDAIESDQKNYTGTYLDWTRGYACNLKAAAQRKIDAITRKLYSFPDGDYDE